ncbi:hypothetical protein Tco_0019546 [Tanacetum coccineum]
MWLSHCPIYFGFEWGCFSIVSDSTADNSRHLKKIFQWSSMLDMNLVRESVPSFDQTRLVLEFRWNSNIQERAKALEVVQYVKEYKHKGKYEAATTVSLILALINEENREMPGSGSVAKKVELKADKCGIHLDDGLEQKLQDPIATDSSGENVCQGITLDAESVADADLVLLVTRRPTTSNIHYHGQTCECRPRQLTAEQETLLLATLIHEVSYEAKT